MTNRYAKDVNIPSDMATITGLIPDIIAMGMAMGKSNATAAMLAIKLVRIAAKTPTPTNSSIAPLPSTRGKNTLAMYSAAPL